MITRTLIICSIAAALSAVHAAAPEMVRLDMHDAKALAQIMVSMPKPDYPLAARARHMTGYGVYDVWFHLDTGVVSHVDIIRSTGSKLLDDAAIRGLRQ